MSYPQRTNQYYTTTDAFTLTFFNDVNYIDNYKLSSTTNKILAAVHYPILHHSDVLAAAH